MPQYQGVWTLEAQAQAQSNQQWVTDPNFKNTTLLLQADGTGSGSQNQTFLDGSTNNFFITRNGNTTQGSFSPFSQAPGYWGNYFSGSSAWLSTSTTNSAMVFGTAAYTVEAWVYLTVGATKQWIIGGSGGFQLFISTSNYLTGSVAGVSDFTASTTALSLNTWTHIAVVRSSTSSGGVTYYVNGVAAGTATDANNYTTNVTLNIAVTNGGTGSTPLGGYLSNVRVVKGTAVYTSAFTPSTTPLTAISGTSVLTCQSNQFLDNSTNAYSLTPSGTPSVQTFSPFAPALQWTSDVVGGSGYFDGTGDNLTLAPGSAFAFGTGDFTIEQWFYAPSTLPTYAYLIDARNSGQTSTWATGFNLNNTGAGQFTFFDGVAATAYNEPSASYKPAAWNHCVVVRSGTTFSMYMNGVRVYTTTNSTNFSTSPTLSYIGRGQATGSEFYFPGYMAGIRIVKGTAVYTPSSATLTIPTAPPTAITNTALLLNYTNAGIYDGKMANNLETVGNAQVATSPVKYGSGSIYFDGSGDYLVMPQSPPLSVGSGNFTYEMWLFPTDITDVCVFDTRTVNNTTTGFAFLINASSFLSVYTSSTVLTCTTALASNVWQHVAVVRSNGILYVYLNGVSIGSAAFTNTLSDKTFRLGAYVDGTGNYNGFMDDVRLTNGLARYFTTFTPPQQALPRQ